MKWGKKEDRYYAPGTKVRRDAHWDGAEELTSEYGVVVHCWMDNEIGMYDCFIAFFGDGFPDSKPDEKPYVLRYHSMSLIPSL